MSANTRGRNAVPVSDLATQILDPVLRKRAGMSVGLVQNWEEIVGERLAGSSRPERIAWPRRASDDDPFQPATMVIACSGAAALRVQHEANQIVERVNAYLGFPAIGRLRIVQKHVEPVQRARPKPRTLSSEEERSITGRTQAIEDPALREALARLGRSVTARKQG